MLNRRPAFEDDSPLRMDIRHEVRVEQLGFLCITDKEPSIVVLRARVSLMTAMVGRGLHLYGNLELRLIQAVPGPMLRQRLLCKIRGMHQNRHS